MNQTLKKIAPFVVLLVIFISRYFRIESEVSVGYDMFITIFGLGFFSAMIIKQTIDLFKQRNQ